MQSIKTVFLRVIFLLLLVLGLNGETAVGGGLFTDSGQNLGNDWSTDVALGDLDGDVDLDAFVVNGPTDSQVWINQGGEQGGTKGVYQDSGQTLNTVNGRSVALGDLDGDLDLDAFVILDFGTDSYQVWINQGGAQGGTAGIFQRNAFTVNDNFSTNVVLGDVDGDTDLDAYIPRIFDVDQLYLNDGTGLFTNSGQNLDGADVFGAGLADLDGDTDLDIFTAVENGGNTVWINQGELQGGTEGVFVQSGQDLGSGQSLNVALGDVDNDNDLDAFVANTAENIVWINQGGTQGGEPGFFQFNGQLLGFSGSTDVQLADFDNDNDLDAFVAEFGGNTVWINQGGTQGGTVGQFVDSGLLLGNETSTGVALADVDGDGDTDAFVANSGPAPNKVYLNGGGSPPLPVNPEGWQIEVVDTRDITGKSTSLALDGNDHPHISFVAESIRSSGAYAYLYYGRWDGIRWHKTEIDRSQRIGRQTSIAVDSQGYPHILYTKEPEMSSNLQLQYAFWDGTVWQIQAVDGDVSVDNDISLALDSNDQPHISYVRLTESDHELRYAVWNGTTWQIETLEINGSSVWESISLAVDANDRPHLSFYDDNINAVRYAHNDGSGWQLETVEEPAFLFSSFVSLAVDGNNYPHIAYTRDWDNEIAYAQWDGAAWQIQTILTVPFTSNFTGNLSLALDSSSNPHISYAYDENNMGISLRYLAWDGAQWQNEILDNSGSVGLDNDIAIDTNDHPHISYYKGAYGDLRYLHWDTNWQIRTVPDPGQIQAVDLQVNEGIPSLGYHNTTSTLFNVTQWDTAWDVSPLTSIASPTSESSMLFTRSRQHVSYYDAGNQRLTYAGWDGTEWLIRVIDNEGDVGRFNRIVSLRNSDFQVAIAYWDATNRQIKLAIYDNLNNVVQIYPNTMQPTLTAASGYLSAASSTSGDVGVTYWDEGNQTLRYAVWNRESALWVMDEVVDTLAGQLNSVQVDSLNGYPVVAYYDEVNDTIMYGYRNEGGWQMETAVPNAGTVNSLDLELGFQSFQYPRIAYTTVADGRFAHKQNSSWQIEIFTNSGIPSAATALTLDDRPHLAYPHDNTGLQYIFRTATLDADTALHGSPPTGGGTTNPLTPCAAIINLFFNFTSHVNATIPQFPPDALVGQTQPLNDTSIFEGMAGLFSQTTGGQHYIDLYFDHITEMGQLGLDDLDLLADAYGTLQNFLPGLEALVTGNGDQIIVTQVMVDDALDIWTRLAAAASPSLANAISTELTQTNNLQDFVGMSFDEWAESIGVEPPPELIYLPFVRR